METEYQFHRHASIRSASLMAMLALRFIVFTNANAATTIVETETKLFSDNPRPDLFFGDSVGISGTTAAVGALDLDHGVVSIFDKVGTNWFLTQNLVSRPLSAIADAFGAALALENNLLVVGNPQGNTTIPLFGNAFVFRRTGSNWIQQALLTGTEQGVFGAFGASVSLSSATIAVADPAENLTNGTGAAYVFIPSGTNWVLQAKLTSADAGEVTQIRRVAISGDTLIVSAAQGSVYVFERNGTNWSFRQKLQPSILNGDFGASVAIDGNIAVVGAPNPDAGSAYVFVRSGTNWLQQQQLFPSTPIANQFFASVVAIENTRIIIGAPNTVIDGANLAGAAYVFELDGSTWVQTKQLQASDASANALFGTSVDLNGSSIIVGAPGDSEQVFNSGAAYIFGLTETNVPPPTLTASPNLLFPPNKKLVPVTITISNESVFTSCHITSVTSSELTSLKAKKEPDFIITGDLTLLLRAERSGKSKNGRIYTITVECTSNSGTTTNQVTVKVPHDRSH